MDMCSNMDEVGFYTPRWMMVLPPEIPGSSQRREGGSEAEEDKKERSDVTT